MERNSLIKQIDEKAKSLKKQVQLFPQTKRSQERATQFKFELQALQQKLVNLLDRYRF